MRKKINNNNKGCLLQSHLYGHESVLEGEPKADCQSVVSGSRNHEHKEEDEGGKDPGPFGGVPLIVLEISGRLVGLVGNVDVVVELSTAGG